QATRSALEAQATRQALDLTATAQHYRQIVDVTQTAIAVRAAEQAIEATTTAGALSVQATRQTLDEQEIAGQRERANNLLRLVGAAALAICAMALVIATGLVLRRRSTPQPTSAEQESVERATSTPGDLQPGTSNLQPETSSLQLETLVIDVPRTRIISGEAADQGAHTLAQLLDWQGEYDEEPSIDQDTNPT
ncbi:MAG: hypothetical protein JW850_00640, partial [Thermoflexales bacterium]|nr:hypothetical protein [Thermoflexales bacterium]